MEKCITVFILVYELCQILLVQVCVCGQEGFGHQPVDLADEVGDQDEQDGGVVCEVYDKQSYYKPFAELIKPYILPITSIEVLKNNAKSKQTKYNKSTFMLNRTFFFVTSIVDKDIIKTDQ